MRTLIFLTLPFLFAPLIGAWTHDLSNTGAFRLTAYNKSHPNVNGKKLVVHKNGNVFLDVGRYNPPSTVELIAFLEDTKLRRIRQYGGAPGTEGNLNFGT
jgi:hypothetical protein